MFMQRSIFILNILHASTISYSVLTQRLTNYRHIVRFSSFTRPQMSNEADLKIPDST